MDDLYRPAVLEGLREIRRSLPGDDPMKRAWRVALARLVDDLCVVRPEREGALRLVHMDFDPGETPYRYDIDRKRGVALIFTGAILGRLLATPLLISLGVSHDLSVFLGTAVGTAGFSIFGKQVRRVDEEEAERRLLATLHLAMERMERAVDDGGQRKNPDDTWIGRALSDLKSVPREQLETAVESLLIEAENRGYQGLSIEGACAGDSDPLEMVWSSDLSELYEPFGHYEEGTSVIEERPPVIRDGAVISKGLVRRSGI